ncbi:hypothetical protein SANTM175S_06724 [Streptomyces antimycoticus]
MRSRVDFRLSASGPRMAFCTKLGPPSPWLVPSRLSASAICVSSRARLRSTSARASAGISGREPATAGQLMVWAALVDAWRRRAVVLTGHGGSHHDGRTGDTADRAGDEDSPAVQ